jgi:hypothetical protein
MNRERERRECEGKEAAGLVSLFIHGEDAGVLRDCWSG